MTEQQSRRSQLPVVLAFVAVLGVAVAGIATLSGQSDRGEPWPAAASGNPEPPPMPSLDDDTVPPPVGPPVRVPTRTGTPNAADLAQAARWESDMPRKPVFPVSAGPGQTYVEGAVLGTACAPAGALGHTHDGSLMTCAPTASDPKKRWREVVPPASPGR
ncbi:hypothetical protein BJ973_007030 [Actinoplanes tereljensis]|uniref:Uncharacterized protein n=1 Tax=Paractinoplanes tereljensis TaxID=571912 RepID=A0A919NW22_9ACTN|nr:hypothetical protein [Actinoplanes tereljensis]GIF24767.1 hypothetical protein Ate02nite_74970 [Actinoplanes tereljensis]